MSTALLFWVLMILWLIFGIVQFWPATGTRPWPLGGHVLIWILLALLGWRVFGAALHG